MSTTHQSDPFGVDGADGHDADLDQSLRQLRRYERRIDDVLNDIEHGTLADASKLPALFAAMMKAKDQLIAQRGRLHDEDLKNQSRRDDHDIDFDAMRASIGCRLGKLRTCCHSKRLSERSE